MIRNACCLVPKGFYFGKHHSVGSIEYALTQARQTEYDTIGFGIQTLASSAQIFRLESDLDSYSLEYELVSGIYFMNLKEKKKRNCFQVGGRSFIKLNLGEKQPEIYSALAPINDGVYHTIKVIRRLSKIEFYVDENPVNLKAENSNSIDDHIKKDSKELFFPSRKSSTSRTTCISCSTSFTYWKFSNNFSMEWHSCRYVPCRSSRGNHFH